MIRGITGLIGYSNSRAEKMLEEIKVKREIMIDCANKKGFTNDETIRVSQELDELINEYQRIFRPTPKETEDVGYAFFRIFMIWLKSFVEI